MLKKPSFSPTQPRHAETCLNPGFILLSLRGETYGTRGESLSQARGGRVRRYASPLCSLRPRRVAFFNILRRVPCPLGALLTLAVGHIQDGYSTAN